MMLYIKTAIIVNDKDLSRCSIQCQHIQKIKGIYCCALFGDHVVDTGEDDDIGYGFQRVKNCIDSVIDQPHSGSFAGDL